MRQTPRAGCAALLAAVALYASAHAADARGAVRPSVAGSAAVLLGRARLVGARVTRPTPPSSVIAQNRLPIVGAECLTCERSSAAAVKKQPLPRPHVEADRESRVLSWTGFQIVGFGDELTVGQRDFLRLTLTGPDGRRVHFLAGRDRPSRTFVDLFATAAMTLHRIPIGPYFRLWWLPDYPEGRYTFTASTRRGRLRTRTVFNLRALRAPSGPIILRDGYGPVPPGTVLRLLFAGFTAGSPIETSVYWRRESASDDSFQPLSALPVVAADTNGVAEIDATVPPTPTSGQYCFILGSAEGKPSCGTDNTAYVTESPSASAVTTS